MPPDEANPGIVEEDLRMRALADVITQMEENEREFHVKQAKEISEQDFGGRSRLSVPSGTSRPSRPCSFSQSVNRTVQNSSVTFSNKHSAMSTSYSSPRQYTLSASTVQRSASGLLDHLRQRSVTSIRLKSLATTSTKSFDYDEYEGTLLKHFFK